ncbi:MAG: DUF3078 domain-containing protein [Bacteroidales bacterium]|nr:DUF3078 domain-containing protein [Bacteroidales bacterium]
MKRIIIIAVALFVAAMPVRAQETSVLSGGTWTTSSTPALKIGEFIFNNWSSTGNSQIDVTATFFGNYKYTHPKYTWDNVADLAYGYAWQNLDLKDDVFFETRRKSNDKIDLTSALTWTPFSKWPAWGASFTANLKTQFGEGREYADLSDKEGKVISSFFAPAYLTTALSFEYKKPDWSVSLSFLTGKTTFVLNDSLLAAGYTYGIYQKDLPNYTHVDFSLGSYIKAQYLKKDILPSLDLYARLELFYAYKKPSSMAWDKIEEFDADANPGGKPEGTEYSLGHGHLPEYAETWKDLQGKGWLARRAFETDLDFEVKLDYRFSKHIAANFALNLKWDTDFSGIGSLGHWQLYQMAGVQIFFNWKTPKE